MFAILLGMLASMQLNQLLCINIVPVLHYSYNFLSVSMHWFGIILDRSTLELYKQVLTKMILLVLSK